MEDGDDADADMMDGDGGDDDDGLGDADAGPALPGGQEFEEDDEEGRFFGGGVSGRQKEILDFMDEREGGVGDVGVSFHFLGRVAEEGKRGGG